MKTKLLLFFLLLVVSSISLRAQSETPKLPIMNGLATSLPNPMYLRGVESYCAEGKVEIEIFLDSDGRVLSAKAISGDELLYDSAIASAKQATFGRIVPGKPQHGLIVYTFRSHQTCIDIGVVNKKATFIPKPVIPVECRCSGVVNVSVVIDESGKVISARAFSGHALLRKSAETSAMNAKFPANVIDVPRSFAKGILTYSFLTTGEVITVKF